MIVIKKRVIETIPVLEVVASEYENKPIPLVIFYHGWTSVKERVLSHGYELAKQGIRAILPDAIYHGERQGKSDFTKVDFWEVVGQAIKDYPQIINYYQTQQLILEHKIGVSGLSMGGMMTCGLIAAYPDISSGVCLMGTPCFVAYSRQLLSEMPSLDSLSKESIQKELDRLKLMDLSFQPEKIAGRPVHFWHGTEDPVVPLTLTEDFFNQIKENDYASAVTFTTTKDGHEVPYSESVNMARFFAKQFID